MKNGKGWFVIPGVQAGDRTIEQQMTGLEPLCAVVRDRGVLDLGCAEGLVAMQLVKEHGAAFVDGVSLVASEIEAGQALCQSTGLKCVNLYVGDLNMFDTTQRSLATGLIDTHDGLEDQYSIVLMLAILHKLKDPRAVLGYVVGKFRPELLVIRTAAATPGYVQDPRGDNVRLNLEDFLVECGYGLEQVTVGPFDEWTGYFRLEE